MSRRHELLRHGQQLGETREIVSAMKAMAFIEVRRLGRFLDSQRRVVDTLRAVAADFLSFYPQALPPQPRQLRRVYLLVGSERGFCGNFNESLLQRLQQCVAGQRGEAARDSFGLIGWGQKLGAQLEGHPQLLASVEGAAVLDEVGGRLLPLVRRLADLQAGSALALAVIYHDAERRDVIVRELLPPFATLRHAPQQFPFAPQLNLAPRAFLLELVEQYLFAALHEILYVSLMAENQQRMQHLDGAQRHLDEKLEALRRRGNQLRQEEITEEIEVILLNADSAKLPPQNKPREGEP
ncbi:FoF1 ATP synthase subunit gamma [Microbulbifer magnicolonia]|uniref:F0F1 ATP synthase subunit gamma n=1 Tax=Microbulbifer magnicolonia TaxID=3109744 RepID=UPI002B402638|nr:FoF1 ATP synthase subunit gamma [Microbulbifer sp. GG15]